MRVIVVGTSRERRELRAALEASLPDIVGEFESLSAARGSAIVADAIVVASRPARDPDEAFYPERLTPRELEVLEGIAEGLSNKGIAERLGISDQTVKFHIASLTGKLGAANRTDAVRRAVRRGIIQV